MGLTVYSMRPLKIISLILSHRRDLPELLSDLGILIHKVHTPAITVTDPVFGCQVQIISTIRIYVGPDSHIKIIAQHFIISKARQARDHIENSHQKSVPENRNVCRRKSGNNQMEYKSEWAHLQIPG